ncbi:MAG: sensor histidine kinase [Betaproteobacteria bacterium]|nr:sensor histidine kinase [Betaproteobacteria bacterium]
MNTGRSVQAPGAEPGSNLLVRLVLAVLAVLAAFPTTAAPATRIVSESLHDNSEVPPPDAAAWSPQALPDNWNISRRGIGGTVWYRFDYRIADPGAAVYAIYLPRVSMNGAVYVNGLLIGSGGSFNEPVARNWNRPLYFLIPPGLLKEGINRVHVRVRGYPDLDGGLTAPLIDADSALSGEYESELFWRIILAQTTSLLIVAVGIFMLMLWIRRRQDAAFGYFGFASLLWAFYTADLYVRDIPVPTFYWELAIRSAFHGFALLLALFATDYAAGTARWWRWLRIAFWGMMALVPVTFFLGGPGALFVLSNFWHVATFLAVSGATIAALVVAWRRRSWEALILIVIGFLTIAFALHDVLMKGGWIADDRVNLLMYAAPPLFLGIGWLLTDRFIRTLAEVETLNRELEARVAEKSAALEANYSRLAQAEKLHALAEERQRLMRDMHDGVGGQLITALAALEGGRTAPAAVAQIVRECIDDLRLVIDSMEPIDDDLLALLGSLRYRLEPRLKAAGMRLVWQVRELPPLPNLTPRNVLHILRVLQEALTNVLKHAGATLITVSTKIDSDAGKALISVVDDGRGFVPATGDGDHPRGRGIGNMRRRAEAVGGTLAVDSGPQGTRITLGLPLR